MPTYLSFITAPDALGRKARQIIVQFAAAIWILITSSGAAAWAGPLEDGITALDAGRYPEAYRAFLKGAKAGNAEAQVQLATMLIEGIRVRRDYSRAAQWLERAATRGHTYAMYQLGRLKEGGLAGRRDPVAAARWYAKAVQRGEPNAAYRLAGLYEKGTGVAANPERALALYRQAASWGVLKANHTLGSILARSSRSDENLIEATMWLELAWRGGDTDAVDELETLRAALTPAQRAVVKSRVEKHLRNSPHH